MPGKLIKIGVCSYSENVSRETFSVTNQIAIAWSGIVTHLGDFSGIPATGKKINVSGINIYQFEGDRITAEFEQSDMLGMVLQTGYLNK